ncbi:PREDICTED: carbon catabolite repressor protein 4 homolog 4 isoform X1 [Lupinus angustifolius]|nr:PREDICTED: carbon catabolite repressor protein 4 homolog 4 isoform X1 [Lupinus angustifolius]
MLQAVSAFPRLPSLTFTKYMLSKPIQFNSMTFSSSSSSVPSLTYPKFVSVEGADIHSRTKPDGFRFTLVSYNILAQAYVKSCFFPHSPSPSLKWKFRSNAVLQVLSNLAADFFCLQEVDEFDSFYKGKMQELGYSSIYMKRSGQRKRDGCGLFYKHDRAELVLEDKIEYNDLVKSIQDENSPNDDGSSNIQTVQPDKQKDVASKNGPKSNTEDRGDPNDPRVRLKRDCVGLLAAFKLKDPSRHVVIVANTHLYWDPELADVKLAQAEYLLSRLAQFRTLVSDRYECIPEVIVAGDFNSQPGDMVYQYLTSGDPSSKRVSESLEEPPVPLCSVYASTRGEPPFTNYTPGFTGTLDYVLFRPSNHIKPISFLELPDSNDANIAGGLPNYSHPSDHLPIGAEFEIIKE